MLPLRPNIYIPMREIIFVICLCLGLNTVMAQQQSGVPTFTRSEAFKQPEDGASRLLLMKNGNTMFFHFTEEQGISVNVYDPQHHTKGVVNNPIRSWETREMYRADLKALFEVDGNAVIFLEQMIKKHPTLYRLIIDGKTGKLLREDELAKNNRLGVGDGQRVYYGRQGNVQFVVKKDPASDYYAVAISNTLPEGSKDHIEVVHFAPDHKEINRAFFEPQGDTYQYLVGPDIYVNRDEFVFISGYAFNVKRLRAINDSRIFIGKLQKGTRTFESKALDYTRDYDNSILVLKYRKEDKLVYMLNTFYVEKDDNRGIMSKDYDVTCALEMNVLDPAALEVKNHYLIKHPKLSAYVEQHNKDKKKKKGKENQEYSGVIQDFRLNSDSTITYLFEDMNNDIYTYTTPPSAGYSSFSERSVYSTTLGDIGIMNADLDGKELRSYAVNKTQVVQRSLDMLLINRRKESCWYFRAGPKFNTSPGFLSYDYAFVNGKDCIFYNAAAKNLDHENEAADTKKDSGATLGTACATFDGNKVLKPYLFGKPEGKDVSWTCQLEVITMSDDNKIMATIMVETLGRERKAYIMWGNF